MYEAVSDSNISVVYATVSGFAEKKFKFWFPDYLFVFEVLWTDKQTTFIKRNYDDVLKLHRNLTEYFSEKYDSGIIKTPVFIPKLEGKRIFQKNCIDLAEQREMELVSFFKQLLSGDPMISSNKVVVDFFRHRPTDPTPSHTSTNEHKSEDDNSDDEDVILFNK